MAFICFFIEEDHLLATTGGFLVRGLVEVVSLKEGHSGASIEYLQNLPSIEHNFTGYDFDEEKEQLKKLYPDHVEISKREWFSIPLFNFIVNATEIVLDEPFTFKAIDRSRLEMIRIEYGREVVTVFNNIKELRYLELRDGVGELVIIHKPNQHKVSERWLLRDFNKVNNVLKSLIISIY